MIATIWFDFLCAHTGFATGANFAMLVLNLMTWHKNVLLIQIGAFKKDFL